MIAGEARTIEGRLSKGPWIVGENPGASDYMIYPGIKLLLRALALPEARELSSRFLPLEANYPALRPLDAACRIACLATSELIRRTGVMLHPDSDRDTRDSATSIVWQRLLMVDTLSP